MGTLRALTNVNLPMVSILNSIFCGSSVFKRHGQDFLSASLKLEATDLPRTVIDC
jgi:hypothetical protein